MSARTSSLGFTLIEVLVALVVVTFSVGALLGAVTSSASNVIYLKEKTLAEWVALNRLAEIRIDQNMPSLGRRNGNTVMAGTRWQWEEEVTELPVEGLIRVEVRAQNLGEVVDDTLPVNQSTQQALSPSTASSDSTRQIAWTTTVTGVVSSSRSDVRQPIAAPFTGAMQNPAGPPGGNPPPKPGGAPSS